MVIKRNKEIYTAQPLKKKEKTLEKKELSLQQFHG